MPYINQTDRNTFDRHLDPLFEKYGEALSPGQLNYILTHVCKQWLAHRNVPEAVGYADYAAVVAALECAKLEFVRRILTPYEDIKILQNGDVY